VKTDPDHVFMDSMMVLDIKTKIQCRSLGSHSNGFEEMKVNHFQWTTWHYIPENRTLQTSDVST
jgi:hypothetical protein